MNKIISGSKLDPHHVKLEVLNELSNTSVVNYEESNQQSQAIPVNIRVTFLRIGEIDTLNERYQAQAAIDARWLVNYNLLTRQLSRNDKQRLDEGKSVTLVKYTDSNWHPQLFIENALGDLKEQITYSAKKSNDQFVYICEHREIKALLWEKLELHHFPCDVQELSISVGSMLYDDKVILVADHLRLSGINRETFVDQQEWFLYEHVISEQRFVKEFLMDDNDDAVEEHSKSQNERKRSFLVISCHAARRSEYFYWNGYCLMCLITICGFCIFCIPPTLPQNRLQIGVTLLLTSITFRWTVNRSLPTISYLTSLDKYSIISIFILVILCIWHAAMGAAVFIAKHYPNIDTDDKFVWIDRYALFGFLGAFFIMHMAMLVWLFLVPLAYRRQMERNDQEYHIKNRAKSKSLAGKMASRTVTTANGRQCLPSAHQRS
ncbi:unnamed protein product [Rotaria socialis]|uniref:Neurotransmitter-gated ion-channel ligand-binding domain-containing protein n=1 Tax=Rotaria socialis TaxID=392032 RepID=A0A818WZJ9_9BILA|nr:unnamed protein product [Rotaria socialis]CAF4708058.1 unnamed protein product [Rotaria socialis]